MLFSEGQKVRFKNDIRATLPLQWRGDLTFVKYTGAVGACQLRNDSGDTMTDFGYNLDPA